MLKFVNVITGNQAGKLYSPTLWNVSQFMLKGAPYGFLYLILLELFAGGAGNAINAGKITLYVAGIVVCLLLQMIASVKAFDSMYVTAYGLIADARIRLGDHLRALPMGFFKDRDSGDVTGLLIQDMDRVEQNFSHLYPDLISCFTVPAVIIMFMFFADWRMSLAMATSVALAVPVLAVSQKTVRHFGEKQLGSRNNAASRMLEYLQGIQTIKAYGRAGEKFTRLDAAFKKLKDDSIMMEAVPGPFVISYVFILEAGFFSLLLAGTYLMSGGSLTIPVFLLFMVIGYQFYEPLKQAGLFVTEIRYMDIAAERVGGVLEARPLPEPEEDVKLEQFDVEFRGVTFRYKEADVLKNVSFKVPERSITALVGPSGSGKTTIASLIARFWDAGEGQVMVGGRDVKSLKNDRLLSYISMVFQDVYLFNDTIYNNISIGKAGATGDEVIAAAKAARCHDFIVRLPEGYDTMVGEGGSTLSGGEKQRISIARAILKDAPVVILDEATASLDPENEMLVQQAIRELVKSRTLIIIAHRLYTVSKADQILVMDKGEIVERGTHKDLIEQKGLYSDLWGMQQKAHGWKFGSGKTGSQAPAATIKTPARSP